MKDKTKIILFYVSGLVGFPLCFYLLNLFPELYYWRWIAMNVFFIIHFIFFCYLFRGENSSKKHICIGNGAVGEMFDKWSKK